MQRHLNQVDKKDIVVQNVLARIYRQNFLFKLSCDSHFQLALTACVCVFKVITLVGSTQSNYFENATACSKRTLKTTVATQLLL